MSETQLIEFYRKCLEMDFATRKRTNGAAVFESFGIGFRHL